VFVKRSWSYYKDKKYVTSQIAEAYRDPETGKVCHNVIMNLGGLPQHVIDSIDYALKTGESVAGRDVKVTSGDTLWGAGLMAVLRAWKKEKMDRALQDLTEAERQSAMAMVAARILQPSSKLALKEVLADSVLGRALSKKRLCEDELYRVMDKLHENFYSIQKRLAGGRESSPVLLLYDTTSTYFEGTCAEEGQYGYSRDKRWDRYQVVIGLVTTCEGVPLAVEVWPGSTPDKSTVCEQIRALRDRFGIEKAVFIGDKAMHLEASVEELMENGFDYILGLEWREERKQLLALKPMQLEVMDEVGVVEWTEGDVRYVGCASEFRRDREQSRREAGMERAGEQLERLSATSARGRYYSWTRLREKVNGILKDEGVAGLWKVDIEPIGEIPSPEEKARLRLTFSPDEEAIKRRERIEGKYVLQTSLSEDDLSAEEVDQAYRGLHKVEQAFRHIKSYLKIRPVYHYLRRRVRAHVLICFLAFYLVKKMELELREKGVTREAERLLRHWDQLRMVEFKVKVGRHERNEWQWSLGEVGKEVKGEINALGWWRSMDAYRRSLLKPADN